MTAPVQFKIIQILVSCQTSFIKIDSAIQKLMRRGYTDTHDSVVMHKPIFSF
jgi:hypothetical protein